VTNVEGQRQIKRIFGPPNAGYALATWRIFAKTPALSAISYTGGLLRQRQQSALGTGFFNGTVNVNAVAVSHIPGDLPLPVVEFNIISDVSNELRNLAKLLVREFADCFFDFHYGHALNLLRFHTGDKSRSQKNAEPVARLGIG
jgi:hypothetical protein